MGLASAHLYSPYGTEPGHSRDREQPIDQPQQDGHGETSLCSPGDRAAGIDRPVSAAVDLPEGSAHERRQVPLLADYKPG